MYKIYTKDNCSYCTAAKNLLVSKNIPFVEFNVGANIALKEMMLTEVPHAKTVPQIFFEDQYIGGYTQLLERITQNDTTNFLSE
jgi:glutaredoxin